MLLITVYFISWILRFNLWIMVWEIGEMRQTSFKQSGKIIYGK